MLKRSSLIQKSVNVLSNNFEMNYLKIDIELKIIVK